jgi:hypothetical protein
LVYLPPNSPDFNPIKNFFSKLKSLLRIVGVAHQAVAPPFQFLVHLVEKHVGQQAGIADHFAAPPSHTLLNRTVHHDPNIQIGADQPNHSDMSDPFPNASIRMS